MERKLIEEKIGTPLEIDTDYFYGDKPFCIDKLQRFLIEAKKNHATHVRITGTAHDGVVEEVEIETINVYLEHESHFKKRVLAAKELAAEKAKAEKSRQEKQEKQLYEKLKLKYEK